MDFSSFTLHRHIEVVAVLPLPPDQLAPQHRKATSTTTQFMRDSASHTETPPIFIARATSIQPTSPASERAEAVATMTSEQEYQIRPIVQESVLHNTKILSNLHSLTASLFGVSAGILGLESYDGFLVYLVFSFITSLLFYLIQIAPDSLREGRSLFDSGRFFISAFEFWTSGIFGGLSGFILTWTLFYGMVRA